MRRFDAIWHFASSTWTDKTADLGYGSSSQVLAAGDKLYLGARDWIAGMLLFIGTPPSGTPSIAVEQYDGQDNTWKEIPRQERFDQLAVGHQIVAPAYDFTGSGLVQWGPSPWLWTLKKASSTFPESAAPPSDASLFWIRLRNTGAVAVTIDRVLPSMYNTYVSFEQVATFMGLDPLNDLNDPTASLIRDRIRATEDWFDQYVRKTWRFRQMFNERHGFNPYGFRLNVQPPLFVNNLYLWQGNNKFSMTEGRNQEWFVSVDTGMVYFTLPSFRLRYYSFLLSRYIRQADSVEIDYVAGQDYDVSPVRAAIQDIVLMKVGSDIVTQMDWTSILTQNPDAVPKPEKVRAWEEEAESRADEMRGLLLA